MRFNKKLLEWLGSGIISIILLNIGLKILKEEVYLGIMNVLIGFVLLYSTYYALEIKDYIEKNKKFEIWMIEKEELLNTIKDIVILKKVSEIGK
jgi:hypothetical protein